ncbi:uroporphyrinogen-III C-methyltransferase [Carboxylicivirga sp. N1Y90]|uniref:uroporphyrinogen-III C-methyltransferase n=1 Tax=Carboxylicivirga fragile TaxID=3417571 RepID=UPI003D345D7D|nr:uroporphyrinogen-III C-methyltransferase [Marinilabiliaceae bacterium N1Y90]
MHTYRIRSFEPVLDTILPEISKVISESAQIEWEFAKAKRMLSTQELMFLLMEDIDFALIRSSKLNYPYDKQFKVAGVLKDANASDDPLVLLALKETSLDFSEIDLRKKYGKVDIVGFGPGDAELLTLKGNRLLKEATIIFYDDLLDNTYLSQFKAEKRYVGKRKGKHSTKQDDINHLLFEAAEKGHQVVRLKGGDPLIFGRGGEEYHYLKERFVKVEIVPGITSALAAASDAVIPLTSRGVSTSVAFALGHDAVNNKLPKADTLVFYMGASQQQQWASRLIQEGWAANTPVASVRNASLPSKDVRRYTLSQLKKEEAFLPAPSLVIVGHTASEDVKTLGQKWLYTGSDSNAYQEKGIVIHNPMIEVKTCDLGDENIDVLKQLHHFDRIVFASPFAVKEFFKALYKLGLDARALAACEITSLGESSSNELTKHGLRVSPVSEANSVSSLITEFKSKAITDEKVLLPCSTLGFTNLPEQLRLIGNEVNELKLYQTVLPSTAVRHNLKDFHGVVFTSPSTVQNFFRFYGHFPQHLDVKISGEYTQQLFDEMLKETLVNE